MHALPKKEINTDMITTEMYSTHAAGAQYEMSFGKLGVNLGGEIGHASLWRHGLWKKGLFLDDSQGDSKKLNYLTYKLKANFSYKFSAAHSIEANIMYMQDSPEFQSAFVSPRTRNAVTPGLSAKKYSV